MTETFKRLSSFPTKECVKELLLPIIDRSVALMYKRTTTCLSVNEARPEIFVKDGRDPENMPPTAAASFSKLASFVASHSISP